MRLNGLPCLARAWSRVVLPSMVALVVGGAAAAGMPAVVQKASVDVHAAADFGSPTVATLKRDASVQVGGQQGLWFNVTAPGGK